MQNSLNYQLHCYNLEDAALGHEVAFRAEIQKYTGHDFGYWKEIMLLKASVKDLENVVSEELNALSLRHPTHTQETAARQLDMGVSGTEFAISSGWHVDDANFPMRSGDVIKVFICYNEDSSFGSFTDTDRKNCLVYGIYVMGYKTLVEDVVEKLKERLPALGATSKSALVKWVFQNRDEIGSRIFKIQKTWDIDSIYYPCIKSPTLNEYYDSFFKSKSQILLAFGPPGTGKTSFIRDLVCESGKNAIISYDSAVLTSDSTFVGYITDPHFDVIVIEDADELLTSERDELNKVVSKILNISDGLIKLPQKKLIFSTNLTSLKDVDPALLRPGRCFDALEFGKLNREQATAIAEKFGCKLPDGDKFTLGEIFFENNIHNGDPLTTNHSKRIRSIGFQ